jgi:uncharacterized membrane protein
MVAALVLARCLDSVEARIGWQSGLDPAATLVFFGTLAGSMFTFIIFLSSSLLVVIQLASAQLSPRVIGVLFRNRVLRYSLPLFAFTFAFTLAALLRIQTSVPVITAHVAAYLCLASLGVFLFLIGQVGTTLRPSGVLRFVASRGHEEIENAYPRQFAGTMDEPRQRTNLPKGEPDRTVASLKDGVLLAFDLEGLVALARKADCVIELVPQVGNFVAAKSPLFLIFGGGGRPSAEELWRSVALGRERTLQQDPAFAFRIIVDIASKGLSPAINDPTTAVMAIDQLHYLLRSVGERDLDEGLAYDPAGALRLIYPTPGWKDYVDLAVTEIRHFGGTSIQVARRLLAMLEHLAATLPPERVASLNKELQLLRRSSGRLFPDAEDQALADIGDLQGMGGNHLVQGRQVGNSEPCLPRDAPSHHPPSS